MKYHVFPVSCFSCFSCYISCSIAEKIDYLWDIVCNWMNLKLFDLFSLLQLNVNFIEGGPYNQLTRKIKTMTESSRIFKP